MSNNPRCSTDVLIPGFNFSRYGQCSRKGVIEHDGHYYCRQHDPKAVQKREDAREARYRVETKYRSLEIRGPAFYKVLLAIAEGAENPIDLAKEIIKGLS